VLYHDTDSIKYIVDEKGYNVNEGSIVGNWEAEYTEHGFIEEFIGHAPKSYGQKFTDNHTTFKCKGISTNLATENAASYKVIRKQVCEHLGGQDKTISQVPQMVFKNNLGGITETQYHLKKMSFHPDKLKGELVGSILYPFGYCHECEKGTCQMNKYHDLYYGFLP
jgi:hypothetical protein